MIALVGLVGYFVVEAASDEVEFTSVSHAGVQHSLFVDHDEIYIGKSIKWTGEELPIIEDIKILTKEGEVLEPNNSEIQIDLWVDETNRTQILYGDLNQEQRELISNYQPVEGYQMVEPEMNLIMQVKLINPNYQYHLESFMIEFTQNGKTKTQELPLKNFIFH